LAEKGKKKKGLMVLEAWKVVNSELDHCRATYLRRQPSAKRYIMPVQLAKPNPSCYVCSRGASIYLTLNLEKVTLRKVR
jgi:ubiquitin-like 1-activating enzyme E1 B